MHQRVRRGACFSSANTSILPSVPKLTSKPSNLFASFIILFYRGKPTNSTMNLDRALVLLLASIGAVAGFSPSGRVAFSVASSHSSRVTSVPSVRVVSALSSEVEQAAEAATAPAFDAAIHVGNISFGETLFLFGHVFCNPPPIHHDAVRLLNFDIVACSLMKSKIPLKVISGMSFLLTDLFPRSTCRLTEKR